MKKNVLSFAHKSLVLFIVFLSVNTQNVKAQGTCATATNIAALPYNTTGLTNCGKGANYSGTPACLTATNFAGEDYVFTYTPAATGCVNALVTFSVASSPWNSGFAILDKCPTTAGATCVGNVVGTLGTTTLSLLNINLTAGTTYYFVVSGGQSLFNSPPNECFGFDFKLTACPVPPPPLPTTPQGIECGSNLGFEDGNLSGWTGYTGTSTQTPVTVGLIPGASSVNGTQGTCGAMSGWTGTRHTLTTGGGFDPNTDNVVPVVAPGCRTNSMRLGNDECGYQAEAMEKTFLVTTSNVLFTYLYAVVLQNPAGHTTANQPRFDITIKNNGGAVISCGGTYAVTADNALSEGFTRATNPPCGAPDVWYKNWTAVGTDLTPYIGQNVTIKFTTVDCTQGGHFGYAYVDTYCKPKEIFGTKVCTLGSTITLTAPQGFTGYTWSPGGGTGQTITVNNPHDGDIYTVSFQSIVGTSCTSTVTDTIKVINATAIGDTTICSGATGTKKFTTTSTDAAAVYSWTSTPAGFTSSSPTPSVTLPSVTTVYKVVVTSPLGCTLSKSVTITVNPPPTITVNSPTVCKNVSATLTATGGATYLWSTSATTTAISVTPATTTSYTVTGTSAAGCTNTAISTVTVNPLPAPTASANTPCVGSALNLTSTTGTSWSWTGPNSFTSTSQSPSIPSATVAMNGTYTVIATALGCTGSATVTVTVNPLPVVSVNSPTICPGTTATLTAVGATTYLWSTGVTTNPLSVSPASTSSYTVTGTSLGCTASAVATVTVSPPCGVNVTATSITICNGLCATVTASGNSGTPPYSFSWSPGGETTTSLTACPVATTSYTITLNDNVGNTATAVASIIVNPNPVINVTPAAICFGGSTSLTATGADSYTWLPATGLSPATGSPVTANPTATTTYTVTGTIAATGCTGSTTVVVTVNPNPTVSVPPASICVGGSSPLTATGADTYVWSPATGLSGTTGTTVTANPTVTSTFTVVGTTLAGCTGSTTVIVTVGSLVADAGPDKSICSGSSATLNATGGTTYSWSPGTGLSNTTVFNPTANPTVSTTYTVTVTSGICTDTDDVVVVVDPPIILNIAGFPPKCAGGTDGQAVVIPSGGDGVYSYQWAPVAGTAASVNGPAGTYTVIVTDQFGCSASASTIVTDPTPVIGTTSVITAHCNKSDGSATVATVSGGTPGYTYSWNTSPVQNTQTASNIPTGNYTVTVTDANGCTTTIAAFVPNAGGVTVSTTKTDVTCFGGNNGSATATGSGGTLPYTYLWNNGQNTNVNSTLTAGTYTITLTDVNGCSIKTSVTITQPTPVVLTSTNGVMCPLTSATVTTNGSGGTGAISYTWNPGALTGASVTVSPAATTTYTITGTDANGCTTTVLSVVTVNPVPTIVSTDAAICFGNSTTLTVSGANSYSWSPSTGISPTTGNSVTANPTATTTYTIIGTDANGCTNNTTVVVTVNPLPVIVVPPAGICPGDSTSLTASGAVTYSWSPATGITPTTGATVKATPNNTTTYTITGTNAFGCTAATPVIVTVHPKPNPSFNASPNPASVFDPTISFTDHTNGGVKWDWTLGDKNNTPSTQQNPSFTYPDSIGTYKIRLIVTNQFGCIDTTYGTVVIKGEYTFFIPNTFTPNGDGTNDYFFPKGTGIDETDYDLWIFDRWGNLIWHTETWGEQWDGRANYGENVAQIDTYVWKVHVREKDAQIIHNYIGHVNIVK
jgi:gliding motility-associated-like protein